MIFGCRSFHATVDPLENPDDLPTKRFNRDDTTYCTRYRYDDYGDRPKWISMMGGKKITLINREKPKRRAVWHCIESANDNTPRTGGGMQKHEKRGIIQVRNYLPLRFRWRLNGSIYCLTLVSPRERVLHTVVLSFGRRVSGGNFPGAGFRVYVSAATARQLATETTVLCVGRVRT